MRYVLLLFSLVALSGCAIFSTPGKVTSSDATTEAGGVYGKVIQNPNGVGCPSVVGQGAQTMGSMKATCMNNGQDQAIELTAPDPNPAITTAYQGINQITTQLLNFAQSLVAAGLSGAAGIPKVPGVPTTLGPAAAPTASAQAQCAALGRTLVVTPDGAVCQ